MIKKIHYRCSCQVITNLLVGSSQGARIWFTTEESTSVSIDSEDSASACLLFHRYLVLINAVLCNKQQCK